jgi:hypothetical protein
MDDGVETPAASRTTGAAPPEGAVEPPPDGLAAADAGALAPV